MDRIKPFRYPLLIIIAIIVGTGLFFVGSKYALDHLSIRQISPTQAANAMKDDHFWRSYRENTLLITGNVKAVTKRGNYTIVSFKTESYYDADCSLSNFNGTISDGQTIKVLTIANDAEREPSGVKLNKCILQ